MKTLLRWTVAVTALAVVAQGAIAQGPPGGIPPAAQAKMNAWRKWRDNHKHIDSLRRTVMAFIELEKDPKTQLSKDQAKDVLAVLKAWRNKPVMTDDQAGEVNKKLTAKLTPIQIKKIATAQDMTRGGRGFGGGARMGGGPGGGGGGGRPGGGFDFSKIPDPKDYNPLNPDTMPFEQFRPMAKQRMDELTAKLQATK